MRTLFFTLIALFYRIRYKRLHIEKGAKIYPSTSVVFHYTNSNSYIKIGKGVWLGCFEHIYRIGWHYPVRISIMASDAFIDIGEGSYLNGVNLYAKKSITIGENAHIASGVQISDCNGHLIYQRNRIEADKPCPIRIGDNVWIGLNAIILKGSDIGDNSVVAAGSIVKGVFPKNSLIAGNPAQLIKILDDKRFI